jgi:hypothetical protein
MLVIVAAMTALHSPNLVSGANEAGYHLLNVNYGAIPCRLVADTPPPGCNRCPQCGTYCRCAASKWETFSNWGPATASVGVQLPDR